MTTTSILRTESEAASLLGVSVCSLKRLRLAGQGPPLREDRSLSPLPPWTTGGMDH